MKATIPFVKQCFDTFNSQIFGGELPAIPIVLCNARTFMGACTYKKRRNIDGSFHYFDFCLKISNHFEMSQDELEDIILHEMIHYFLGINQAQDTSSHGVMFKQIMNYINTNFHRNITLSHKLSREQTESTYDTRKRMHVIAVVYFKDGRVGVKSLTRNESKIVYYYNNILSVSRVSSIKLYLSDNIYFNRFPTSSALNVVYVDEAKLKEALLDSLEIKCDGKNIV